MIDLVQTFKDGGICMWPLGATALTGIAVIFERTVTLNRMPASNKAEKQLDDVEKALSEGGLEECAKVVAKGKGALNYVFARLLKRYDTLRMERRELAEKRKSSTSEYMKDPVTKFFADQAEFSDVRDELLMTMDEAVRGYVGRYLPALNTVATTATLWGLLGTITGMISAFHSIALSGTGDPKVVAAGIAEALITTATGLFIAIPATIGYRIVGSMAEKGRSSIELYVASFANTLMARIEKGE